MATNHIRFLKRIIKISVAVIIILSALFLGLFVKNNQKYENSNMSKWLKIPEPERMAILTRTAKDMEDKDLLMSCVDKIASLPDSNEMIIRDAISLCYNGIKLNANTNGEAQ